MDLWPRPSLELRFDVPREVGLAVFAQHFVCADCVEVFRVDQEPVHVEEAGADRWEACREAGPESASAWVGGAAVEVGRGLIAHFGFWKAMAIGSVTINRLVAFVER